MLKMVGLALIPALTQQQRLLVILTNDNMQINNFQGGKAQ